jgi:hypothetical protein
VKIPRLNTKAIVGGKKKKKKKKERKKLSDTKHGKNLKS